eukprot:5268235-Alexandrium_andersonii.AAC.1
MWIAHPFPLRLHTIASSRHSEQPTGTRRNVHVRTSRGTPLGTAHRHSSQCTRAHVTRQCHAVGNAARSRHAKQPTYTTWRTRAHVPRTCHAGHP